MIMVQKTANTKQESIIIPVMNPTVDINRPVKEGRIKSLLKGRGCASHRNKGNDMTMGRVSSIESIHEISLVQIKIARTSSIDKFA